jgi:hypothetical protein
MSTQYPQEMGPAYYFMFDRVFIVADQPGAQEAMKACPDVPVVNQGTLDLIEELLRSKATAEGKLALFKKVMETL